MSTTCTSSETTSVLTDVPVYELDDAAKAAIFELEAADGTRLDGSFLFNPNCDGGFLNFSHINIRIYIEYTYILKFEFVRQRTVSYSVFHSQ